MRYDPTFEAEVGERAARTQPALLQAYLHGRVVARKMHRHLEVERLLNKIAFLIAELKGSD